jgi:acyl-CoA thioester hydrolase
MQTVYENVVRFAETDAQGIVFYGNYVTFQDETVTSFMADLGFAWDDPDREWDIHAVNVELNYHDSATFREHLRHGIRATAIRESSIELAYECRRADDDSLIADGTVTHVVVDEGGDPMRVPDDYREAVLEFQDEPPNPV